MSDLPVIQKTYDLIKWYVPILNQLPRDHKFLLGDRIIAGLYDLLEGLIKARYAKEKLLPVIPVKTGTHPFIYLKAIAPSRHSRENGNPSIYIPQGDRPPPSFP